MSKMGKFERLMKGLWHMYNEAGGMIGSYIEDDGVRVGWKIALDAPPEKVDVLIKSIELVANIAAMKAEDEGVI